MQKAKWLSEEILQIAVKRTEAKSKGGKEKYTNLNAEFQKIARRDKKAFLSDQCKEIEEKQLNGHEFEETLGDVDGQGSLACCSSWGHKESDTTE